MPLASLALAAALFASQPPDPASDPDRSSEARVAAKLAFDEGLEAVADERYDQAIDAFHRAHALHPHPVTLFNLALSLEKADRLPESWSLFERVLGQLDDPNERQEVRRHLNAIEARIAIVEVDAQPTYRLCIDGHVMPAGPNGRPRMVLDAGTHGIDLDEHHIEIDLGAGERRLLLLDDPSARHGDINDELTVPMLGVTIGGGALAIGFGIGAAVAQQPDARTGMAIGAASGAGLAVGAGLVALLLDRRLIHARKSKRRQQRDAEALVCPGSPAIAARVDVQLAESPPVELPAGLPTTTNAPTPTAVLDRRTGVDPPQVLPRPIGIRPPRAIKIGRESSGPPAPR